MTTITAPIPAGLDSARPARGTALRDIATISKRNLRRVARTPRLLVVSAVPPVLFVVLFRYVFGGAIHTSGGNYADYLLPTVLILTQLLGATTAVALATDLAGGMVDRFRSLPIARSATLAGRTVADLARATLVLLVGLGAGAAVGFRFHGGLWPGLAGLGLVLAFSYVLGDGLDRAETPGPGNGAGRRILAGRALRLRQLGVRAGGIHAGLAAGLRERTALQRHHQRGPRADPGRPHRPLPVAVGGLDRRHPRRLRRARHRRIP
jgi:hypothetical protein